MVDDFTSPEALARLAEPLDAVVIGPAAGLTETTALNLAALGRTGAALVVDADALTLFKDRARDLFACLDRDDVLTPHEGEFERVFPGLLTEGRESAARKAAERAGAVVVLKGRETVIASPDSRLVVNGNGTPWLATAGSGVSARPCTWTTKMPERAGRCATRRFRVGKPSVRPSFLPWITWPDMAYG